MRARCQLARKCPAVLQFVFPGPRTRCATRTGVSARQRPCYRDIGVRGHRTLSCESAPRSAFSGQAGDVLLPPVQPVVVPFLAGGGDVLQVLGQGDLFRRVCFVVEVARPHGLTGGVDDDGTHGAVLGQSAFVDGGAPGLDRLAAAAEHLDGHAVRVALAGQEVEGPVRTGCLRPPLAGGLTSDPRRFTQVRVGGAGPACASGGIDGQLPRGVTDFRGDLQVHQVYRLGGRGRGGERVGSGGALLLAEAEEAHPPLRLAPHLVTHLRPEGDPLLDALAVELPHIDHATAVGHVLGV